MMQSEHAGLILWDANKHSTKKEDLSGCVGVDDVSHLSEREAQQPSARVFIPTPPLSFLTIDFHSLHYLFKSVI